MANIFSQCIHKRKRNRAAAIEKKKKEGGGGRGRGKGESLGARLRMYMNTINQEKSILSHATVPQYRWLTNVTSILWANTPLQRYICICSKVKYRCNTLLL